MLPTWKTIAAIDLSEAADDNMDCALAVGRALSSSVDFLYVAGRPTATSIAARAEEIDADLVHMTARRYGRRGLRGRKSVTRELMRLSRRPICVTSARYADASFRLSARSVICAVGLDGKDTQLLRYAESIALRARAGLVLVHVAPESSEALLHHALEGGNRPLSENLAKSRLLTLADQTSCSVRTEVRTGDPAARIASLARKYNAGVVVAARANEKKEGVYSRHLEQIQRKLRCPLLTIPVEGVRLPARFPSETESESLLASYVDSASIDSTHVGTGMKD